MIPKLHYISQGSTTAQHLDHIQKACSAGAELVQLGFPELSENKFLKLAQEALKITTHFQTRLIICSHYKIAKTLKTDGVYLDKNDVCPTLVRKHLHSWQTIGTAAHNLADCKTALTKYVDYIALGPFQPNNTTESNTLDKDAYKSIIEDLNTDTPVLAYGNITIEDVDPILEIGVNGLSIDHAITADFNRIKTFHQLLNASSTHEMRHSFEKK